jgi:hypothetical protein
MLFFLPKATNALADLYELLGRDAAAEGITEYQIQEATLEDVSPLQCSRTASCSLLAATDLPQAGAQSSSCIAST